MLVMYDSTRISELRKLASTSEAAVAGYVDGRYKDMHELVAAFPTHHHLSIAVRAADDADCLDVESGDATPAATPNWVLRQHHRGIWRPVIYASSSVWPNIEQELTKAKLHPEMYRRWYAEWNGQPIIAQGYDAHQYTDHAEGRSVDASVCLDDFFGAKEHLARVRLHVDAQVDLNDLSWSIVGHGVQPLPWGD